MADYQFRGNLATAIFPFLSEFSGRSVILRGQDQTYVPQIAPKEDADQDIGVPQIYYCHDVMPTPHGYQSIGYEKRAEPISTGEVSLVSVHIVRDENENVALLGHASDGRNFIKGFTAALTWTPTTEIPAPPETVVTTAHVQGITYIYFSGIGCYKYDFGTSTLVPVTLTGLDPTAILGITGAAGYLIAWSVNAIAWSSTIDPTDFTPSLSTGAGGGAVEGSRGAIVACIPLTLGFIVFTSANAVAAIYSNNVRYPFNFREIAGSGGLASVDLVSFAANAASFFAYTTSGIQRVNIQEAVGTLPEASDFLAGTRFEDFDIPSLSLQVQELTSPMIKKVRVISDRYLVFSYGVSQLTHALIYDAVLKRWGKVRITHVDCFEYVALQGDAIDIARKGIAFVTASGEINTVNFNKHAAASGVLLLGKFQYTRQRVTMLQGVEIENVKSDSQFNLYNSPNLDGKSGTFALGWTLNTFPMSREYKFSSVAINHSLACVGTFDINSYVLTVTNHGAR